MLCSVAGHKIFHVGRTQSPERGGSHRKNEYQLLSNDAGEPSESRHFAEIDGRKFEENGRRRGMSHADPDAP